MDKEELIRQAFLSYDEAVKNQKEENLKKLSDNYSSTEISALIKTTQRLEGINEDDAIERLVHLDDEQKREILRENKEYKKFLRTPYNAQFIKEEEEERKAHRIVVEKKVRKLVKTPEDEFNYPFLSEEDRETIKEELISASDEDKVSKKAEEIKKEPDTTTIVVTDLTTDLDTGETLEKSEDKGKAKSLFQCVDCGKLVCLDLSALPEEKKVKVKTDNKDETIYDFGIACPRCEQCTKYKLLQGAIEEEPTEPDEEVASEEPSEEVPSEEGEETEERRREPADFSSEEFDEFDDESFEESLNKYFSNVYKNIKSFTTESVKLDKKYPNKLIVEGKLNLDNGKSVSTTFSLVGHKGKDQSISFGMKNKKFSESLFPFHIQARLEEKKLLFENLTYHYVKEIEGKKILIKG